MKKFSMFSCAMSLSFSALLAVPACPDPIEKTQPDGTKIIVKLYGDEHVHWMESTDGYTLMYNDKKEVVFATQDTSQDLIPSNIVYRGKNKTAYMPAEQEAIEKIPLKLFYSNKQINLRKQIRQISPQKAQTAVLGEQHVLCLLANFSDKTLTYTKADFENMMNQEGYTGGDNMGSVRDFYKENSYGKMSIAVTVGGPVTLPKTAAYYALGGNNHDEFALTTAQLADATVNFADFAVVGTVPTFHILFAGYGDESVGDGKQIWSHASGCVPLLLDNVWVGYRYSCSPELRGSSGTNITGIGVVCHELCHTFGSPDYYDTDNSGSGGQYPATGKWDLMANGSWNGGSGKCPAHINMLQKILYGWVDPITLSDSATITDMPASADSARAYTVLVNANGERYILENRQKKKFDSHIPGNGLLIYHVHQDAFNGRCNNKTHPQQCYVVPASSIYQIPNSAASSYGTINSDGAPFPGTTFNTSFGATTIPMMFSWDANGAAVQGKPITNIAENPINKTISFDFMGGRATPLPTGCSDSITTFPFTETFEHLHPCFELKNNSMENPMGVYSSKTFSDSYCNNTITSRSGDNVFFFSSYNPSRDHSQYLISPKIHAPDGKKIRVSFWFRETMNDDCYLHGNEKFRVGYSSTDANISSFTWGYVQTSSESIWREYAMTAPAGTRYIAIKYFSDERFYLTIDDLTVDTGGKEDYAFVETFSNSDLTATYENGTFTGDNNIRWYYNSAMKSDGYDIDGKGAILNGAGSEVYSETIYGGISNLRVDLKKASATIGNRALKIYVNNTLVATSTAITDEDIHQFTVNNIDVAGNVVIKIAQAVSGNHVVIDNISWNSHLTPVHSETPVDKFAVRIYPNPSSGIFTVEVDKPCRVEIFTTGGIKVAEKRVTKTANFKIAQRGMYLLKGTDKNGEVTTQKLIVE
ncbi:MAG: M6 family metalloprotease domain-containing protein [Bacteroidales bacterium]|jgi:M6 family metalloprotease-like protein|nr:M6 family metalloprotease domain-containing protein [Bacteroidales bacterium]